MACMGDADLPTVDPSIAEPVLWNTVRRYYGLSATDAAVFGVRSPEEPGAPAGIEEMLATMGHDDAEAWWSDYLQCLRAERQHWSYSSLWLEVVNDLDAESFAKMEKDDRVVNVWTL